MMAVPRRLLTCLALAFVAAPAIAHAQPQTPSSLQARADARKQIRAATLLPTYQGARVYAVQGPPIGRIQDIRVSPDGNTIVAIIHRRPIFGGGRISFPMGGLRRAGNKLTAPASLKVVRSMPRL